MLSTAAWIWWSMESFSLLSSHLLLSGYFSDWIRKIHVSLQQNPSWADAEQNRPFQNIYIVLLGGKRWVVCPKILIFLNYIKLTPKKYWFYSNFTRLINFIPWSLTQSNICPTKSWMIPEYIILLFEVIYNNINHLPLEWHNTRHECKLKVRHLSPQWKQLHSR